MPKWTSTPPDKDREHNLPMVRTPTRGPIQAIVTSESLIGCDTHFWHGRTSPCEGEGCDACLAACGFRWHGYLGIWSPKTNRSAIFEFTAATATHFVEYYSTFHTLRGCFFTAQRAGGSANSRIGITMKPYDLSTITLPAAPDLEASLSLIWQLPGSAVTSHGRSRGQPQVEVAHSICSEMRDVPSIADSVKKATKHVH
jgi:hypothetical protein